MKSQDELEKEYKIHPVDAGFQGVCTHCGHRLYNVLPVEPIFDLKTAAAMIPCSLPNLHKILQRQVDHLHPLKIYWKGHKKQIYRFLRAWEVQILRDVTFQTRHPNTKRLLTLHEYYQEFREMDVWNDPGRLEDIFDEQGYNPKSIHYHASKESPQVPETPEHVGGSSQ